MSNRNIKYEKIKEENFYLEKKKELILKYCEEKYNEEKGRETIINEKAGFLLTIVSLLIVAYTALLTFFNNMKIKGIVLINITIYMVIILLFIAVFLILLGINFKVRNYLSNINNLSSYIDKNEDKNKFAYLDMTINTYKNTIESFSDINDKRVKTLSWSIITILVTIGISIITSLIVLGGNLF